MIKITSVTTIATNENINELRESGYLSIMPKMSCSAEQAYLGKEVRSIDIVLCQQYTNCLDCPQYVGCNNLTVYPVFNREGNGKHGW